MKRILTLVLMLAILVACIPLSTAAQDETRTMNFSQMHGYYRTLGRTVEHNSCLYMDNVATGFEMYFHGKGDVTLNATVLCSTDGEIAQYLTVIVDGVRSRIRIECDARHTAYAKSIALASGLAEGYHHIEVYRQTEAQVSNFRADTLTFTGRLLATPSEHPLTIDVVGDSISGGYGALWNSSLGVSDPACNHPYYQDGTQSYAFLAGKALGADVRVLQSSGYGCVGGWNGREVNLQTMYPYLNWFRSQTFLNPFDPLADIVIINLGTNDYSTRTNNNITSAEFQAGAKNLMQMARQYNPGAAVVWCTGMMGSYYPTEVKAAINELGGSAEGYYFLELPKGQGGAVSHPNAAQQQAAGTTLANFLKTTVLPADYTAQTATTAELSAAISNAKAIGNPSAALQGAITRAETELAVNTTDPYRLYARLTDLREAMAGDVTSVNLMPRQYVSETPTAPDGQSYIWPYYGTDGSVTLYKGGEGVYWPQINTAQYQTVDIDETPYLRVEYAGNADFNVSLTYLKPDGNYGYVNAATLAGISGTDLPARERGVITVDFGAYIRKLGHADSEGLVSLISCDLYVIGGTDSYAHVFDCAFTSNAGETSITISGSYPLRDGVLADVAAGTTVDALIAAMDHREALIVRNPDGTQASGMVATGMTLELSQNGSIIDSAVIAVTGDLNGDAAVSSADARLILKALLNQTYALNDAQQVAADPDGDNTLTTGDARSILKSTF